MSHPVRPGCSIPTSRLVFAGDLPTDLARDSDRERALAWTKAVTLISETHVDDVRAEVRTQFSEAETLNLAILIATIDSGIFCDLVPRGAAGKRKERCCLIVAPLSAARSRP